MSDVLVVGGGVVGLLSAWSLGQEGLRVTLVERGETGREASWAGGGILWPLYPCRYAAPVEF
jgi:glycine oxidase